MSDFPTELPNGAYNKRKACIDQFMKLRFVDDNLLQFGIVNNEHIHVSRLDLRMMMVHVLDCLAALRVFQDEWYDQMKKNVADDPIIMNERILMLKAERDVFRSATTLTLSGMFDGDDSDPLNPAVNELLKAFPDDTKMTDGRGWLALHWGLLVTDKVDEKSVKQIYISNPDALKEYHIPIYRSSIENDGWTPLHLFAAAPTTPNQKNWLKYFLMQNPSILSLNTHSRPESRRTPLHIAAEYSENPELIRILVNADASKCKIVSRRNGLTPLGVVCKRKFAANKNNQNLVVDYLLEADKSAFVTGDGIIACLQRCRDPDFIPNIDTNESDGRIMLNLIKKLVTASTPVIMNKNNNSWLCEQFRYGFTYPFCLELANVLTPLLDENSRIVIVGSTIASCIVSCRNTPITTTLATADTVSSSVDNDTVLQTVTQLLQKNPEAGKYRDIQQKNLLHLVFSTPRSLLLPMVQAIITERPNLLKEKDDLGMLPIHAAAFTADKATLEILIKANPDSVKELTLMNRNLLHIAVSDVTNTSAVVVEKVSYLCQHHSFMIRHRDLEGFMPVHWSLLHGLGPISYGVYQAICSIDPFNLKDVVMKPYKAVGGTREAPSEWQGSLPLHLLVARHPLFDPISENADIMRLFLKIHPLSANIQNYQKVNPYRLIANTPIPSYFKRLLLRAEPSIFPLEMRRLNYEARRMAMFLAFRAVSRLRDPHILIQLRFENRELMKRVILFL